MSDAFCASAAAFNSRSAKVMYDTVMFQKGKMFSISDGDFQVCASDFNGIGQLISVVSKQERTFNLIHALAC